MNLKMIKGLVGSVAPTLATAMGSPLAGAAMSVIADKLGVKNEPKEIEKALSQATPEQLLAIKEAELSFEENMRSLDIDLFALESADIQDARKAHKGDWTPKILAIGCLLLFAGYAILITVSPPPEQSDTIPSLLIGAMSSTLAAVVSFYFGASHGGKDD